MNLDTIYTIPLKDIRISEDNVRHHDTRRNVEELAESIEQHGLLQPVVLRGEYGSPPYELISGQRRYLAHRHLKKKDIRAVFAGALDKTQSVIRSLVENMQRVELEYEDTAQAITALYKDFDGDDRKVAAETGLSLRKVRDFINIEARSTPRIKQLLTQKKVNAADVKRALRAAQDDADKAEKILNLIVENRPSSHQKRRIIQYGEADRAASAEEILEKAMRVHIEETIVISLSKEVQAGLSIATKKMQMEPEELAATALSEWLRTQGFVK